MYLLLFYALCSFCLFIFTFNLLFIFSGIFSVIFTFVLNKEKLSKTWIIIVIWAIFILGFWIWLMFFYSENKANGNLECISFYSKGSVLQNWYGRKFFIEKNDLKLLSHYDVNGTIFKTKDMNLWAKGIYYQIKFEQIQENNLWNWKFKIYNFYTFKSDVYEEIVFPIVFGFISQKKNNFIFDVKKLGIIHLVVISGLHFNIIFNSLNKIFRKIDPKSIISITLMLLYYLIINKSPSANRAFIFLLIYWIYKLITPEKEQINKFKILFFTFLITSFINPTQVLNNGFWLSYLLCFSIYGMQKPQLKKSIIFDYFKIWILSILLVVFFSSQFNVFSFLYSLFFNLFYEFFIISLFIFWPVWPLTFFIANALKLIVNNLLFFTIVWKIEINWINQILLALLTFTYQCFLFKTKKVKTILYN